MRLSDAERNEAIEALSEHVRTGRLDIDDFGDRSAKVSAARMRSELVPLFDDLPEPRPSVLNTMRVAPAPKQSLPARWLNTSAVPVAALFAIVLFLTVARGWVFVFVLPAAVALIMAMKSR
jgi:Domain of unknown function (DUF1707)